MQVTWIIERNIFEEEQELTLIKEVNQQGGQVKLIKTFNKLSFDWEHDGWHLENKPVIFRGSLNVGKKARQQAWYPGVICNQKAFNCSTYYTYWGKWMLNKDYLLLPIKELIRNADFISSINDFVWEGTTYKSDLVFIRPDSGMKQFAGGVFNLSDLSSLKDIEPETLVLIAPVKEVNQEWRFVVADNKVITGSQYYEKGKYVSKQDTVEELNYQEDAAAWLRWTLKEIDWQPDPIYTVDVCKSEEEFSILEINSFSCSNLYHCDLSKVVEAANKIAIEEWKEVNE